MAITTPDLTSKAIGLSQVAPGVYEAPLGEIDPGAYVIRVSQTRPGSAALGRTLGLVAPTPAEYRVLGTNEAFLATLRAATNGRAIETPEAPWRHDLTTNASSTDLWPTLLLVALLLWPLDIALRRVSVGRRELADARRWLAGGWRRTVAPRTVEVAGLLAARDRAAGSAARAALLRGDDPPAAVEESASRLSGASSAGVTTSPDASPAGSPSPVAGPEPAPATAVAAPRSATSARPPRPAADDAGDTLSKLRDAKRRARER